MTQNMPAPMTDFAPANPNFALPRYGNAADWIGGAYGDDPGRPINAGLAFSTATLAVARMGGAPNDPDYVPRNQPAKLLAANPPIPAQGSGADIGRRNGSIGPQDPYPKAGDPALLAPTISSLSPSTGAAAAMPITVTITGTNFTPWSQVYTGGQGGPAQSGKYVNATTMQVTLQPGTVAGSVGIVVGDHSTLSTPSAFTVT